MKKIGIVGSRSWDHGWDKIRTVIEKAVSKFGAENLEIVSGGNPKGVDRMVKWLLQNEEKFEDVTYTEYAPAHYEYEEYFAHDPEYYGQEYKATNYFERNEEIAKVVSEAGGIVIALMPEEARGDDEKSRGTKNTLKHCETHGTKSKVIYG